MGNYFEDKEPHNMAKIAAVAVEIWTTSGDIRMDNFIIGESLDDAKSFAEATWKVKADLEDANDKNQKKDKKKSKRSEMKAEGGLKNMVLAYMGDLSDLATENPIPAVATIVVLIFSFLFLCTGGSKKKARNTARPPSKDATKPETADTDDAPSTDKKKKTPRAE